MKLHRVYYKEFSRTDKISIDNKSKINHLSNVLRLKEGSKLDVFDGEGNSSIFKIASLEKKKIVFCLLYTSPSPRDMWTSRMPSSA